MVKWTYNTSFTCMFAYMEKFYRFNNGVKEFILICNIAGLGMQVKSDIYLTDCHRTST